LKFSVSISRFHVFADISLFCFPSSLTLFFSLRAEENDPQQMETTEEKETAGKEEKEEEEREEKEEKEEEGEAYRKTDPLLTDLDLLSTRLYEAACLELQDANYRLDEEEQKRTKLENGLKMIHEAVKVFHEIIYGDEQSFLSPSKHSPAKHSSPASQRTPKSAERTPKKKTEGPNTDLVLRMVKQLQMKSLEERNLRTTLEREMIQVKHKLEESALHLVQLKRDNSILHRRLVEYEDESISGPTQAKLEEELDETREDMRKLQLENALATEQLSFLRLQLLNVDGFSSGGSGAPIITPTKWSDVLKATKLYFKQSQSPPRFSPHSSRDGMSIITIISSIPSHPIPSHPIPSFGSISLIRLSSPSKLSPKSV
jgi:hypothetical protein